MNSSKICFDRNIFIISLIIIILVVLYLMQYHQNDIKLFNMSNLITKSIFDIEKKIINNNLSVQKSPESVELSQNTNYMGPLQIAESQNTNYTGPLQIAESQNTNYMGPLQVAESQQTIEPTQIIEKTKNIEPTYQVVKYNELQQNPEIIKYMTQQYSIDPIVMRDYAVINNPLYPPLARTERPIFDELVMNNQLNIKTRGSQDTFRAIAYIINKNNYNYDLGGNKWRLFGRQSYRGSSRGEFYMSPINNDNDDMKVYLKDDMMIGEKIRDIYALPRTVKFNSPFFIKDEEYEIIELPKADLNSNYL